VKCYWASEGVMKLHTEDKPHGLPEAVAVPGSKDGRSGSSGERHERQS